MERRWIEGRDGPDPAESAWAADGAHPPYAVFRMGPRGGEPVPGQAEGYYYTRGAARAWAEAHPPPAGPVGELLRGADLMVMGASLVGRHWSDELWERAEALARARPDDLGDYATTFPMSFDEWLHQLMAWRDGVQEAAKSMLGRPIVGTRVRFKRTFGDYPLDPMPAGLTGTVTEVNESVPFVVVRLDQRQEQLREWDNEYHFGGGRDEALEEALVDFAAACQETWVPETHGL